MNAKKIAEMLREIASFFASDEGCTNAIYDAQIAIANELDPPAKPMLSDAKVGDFVKYDIDTYLRVIEPSGKDKTLCKTLSGVIVYPYTSCLTKASPSEVRVKIGCLEGTVERHDGNPQYWFKLRSSEYNYALISIDMLDTQTRELVESLLRAQEENNG